MYLVKVITDFCGSDRLYDSKNIVVCRTIQSARVEAGKAIEEKLNSMKVSDPAYDENCVTKQPRWDWTGLVKEFYYDGYTVLTVEIEEVKYVE